MKLTVLAKLALVTFLFLPSQTSFGGEWRDPVTGMEFVWVPGGCYDMGCGSWTSECYDNERPVHKVCVQRGKGFWMGKYEVTQGQWKKVSGGSNPSHFQKGDNYPVEKVSWDDAQDWIKKLNNLSGNQYRFRLPTEAEWEYACRSGGKPEMYAGGKNLVSLAWYTDNVGGTTQQLGILGATANIGGSTHPVGTKQKNGLGIYDMSGNVFEWCEDVYGEDAYSKHPPDNPIYTGAGPDRVLRGGCWSGRPRRVRCALRVHDSASHAHAPDLGFRLVRTP